MDIKQENIDDLNAIVKIKISPEDYQNQYEASLKKYKSQMNLPGFRPGKIPTGVVKKKYGKSILAEEINRILSDSLHNHIQKNELQVLGNPMPKDEEKIQEADWDNPGDFEFSYEVGLAPSFDLKVSEKDKYKYYTVKVDNQLIDKQIDDLRRRYGKLENVEESAEKDMLFGAFAQLDDKGEVLEGGIVNSSTVSIEFVEDKKTRKKLVGLKAGDQLKLDPKNVSKGEEDMATMLGVPKEELVGLKSDFQFTLNEVKRIELAELNQELFDQLFGKDNVKSEEEFKTKIASDLSTMFKSDSDRLFKRDLTDKLLGKLKLSLPDEFLKRWILASNEGGLTQEQIDNEYEGYSKGLKWQLVENKIIKDHDIKVEKEEVLGQAKQMISQQYAQYGIPNPNEDELTSAADSILKNQEEAKRIYDMLYDTKIIEFFKNKTKLDTKELSYDDFVKHASKESK